MKNTFLTDLWKDILYTVQFFEIWNRYDVCDFVIFHPDVFMAFHGRHISNFTGHWSDPPENWFGRFRRLPTRTYLMVTWHPGNITSWYGTYPTLHRVLAPSKRWLGMGSLNHQQHHCREKTYHDAMMMNSMTKFLFFFTFTGWTGILFGGPTKSNCQPQKMYGPATTGASGASCYRFPIFLHGFALPCCSPPCVACSGCSRCSGCSHKGRKSRS